MRLRKSSITDRTLLMMIIVVLIQSVIFAATLLNGDIVEKTNQNAFDTMNEKVTNRRTYLENDMIQRWSNLESKSVMMTDKIIAYLDEQQLTIDELAKNTSAAVPLIDAVSEDIISILRTNQVTGAFLILGNDSSDNVQTNGIYLRDMDPIANPNDNSDLLCLRAPASITEGLNIPLDIYWNPQFQFNEEDKSDIFYYRVLSVAAQNLQAAHKDLGYWSSSATDSNGVDVILYTLPLLDHDGNVLGILGVDVSLDYLKSLMPSKELNSNASYLLAKITNQTAQLEYIAASGPLYTNIFHSEPTVSILDKTNYINAFEFETEENNQVYGNVQLLSLYNTNSPYADDSWVLVGLMRGQDLKFFTNELYKSCLLASLLSFAVLFGVILVLSRSFTHPIRKLAKEVKNFNPNEPVKLNPTNILEIDNLSSAIEELSRDVAETASSFGRIISMTSYPFSAFEYYTDQERFFCTDQLLATIGIRDAQLQIKNKEDLIYLLELLDKQYPSTRVDNQIRIYRIADDIDHKQRWIRMHIMKEANHIYGVVENVTSEMLELHKAEYERDHDVLTSLLNRRAYTEKMNKLFKQHDQLKVAALVMSDLDNLKYINDTFGHDCGDDYIRLMANVLKSSYPPQHSIISRISGDEFFVFLYGYDSKEEIQKILGEFEKNMNECVWKLPDGSFSKLRATTGVAWYPNDAIELTSLTKYADFAMYRMKHTQKGSLYFFDQEEYENDAYLLQAKEDLNKLIDQEMVAYQFQPIVDAHTGEVYAYEALMRSKLAAFMNPLDILRIARAQSKLYFIEHLTFFKAMEDYVKQPGYEKYRLFINTIANQVLTAEDIAEFSAKYLDYLPNLVLEITEAEKLEDRPAKEKRRLVDEWHAKIAVDDYGTGYNGESVLLQVEPDFIKIDRSIVHNISFDENRQILLQNIISYCKENHILIIAEGIENELEMKTLINAGVDYMQGFYLAQPAYELQDISEQKKQLIREYYETK